MAGKRKIKRIRCISEHCNEFVEPRIRKNGSASKAKRYCSDKCYRLNDALLHPKKYMWRSCEQRAKKKGWAFSLKLEDMPDLPTHCPVLPWVPLERPTGTGNKNLQNAMSIDRIKPDLGYIPENIRIVSLRANHLKSDATIEELEYILNDLKSTGPGAESKKSLTRFRN